MAASAAAAAPPTAAPSMKAKWQRMTDTQLQRVWQLFWRKQLGKGDVERFVFSFYFFCGYLAAGGRLLPRKILDHIAVMCSIMFYC